MLAGTTGESAVLDDEEKLALWTAVRAAVDIPLLAWSTSNDTPHSIELTGRATDTGVDGILAVTPYYNRPGPTGLEGHFEAVATATDLPVMIYDIPVRTGRKIPTASLLKLARDIDNIVAVKDAAGNPATSAALLAEVPEGFELYSGDDSMTLPLLSVGAVGVVGVAAHWSGELHQQMIEAFFGGDPATARQINVRLIPSYDFETGPDWPNPIPTKAMMRSLGFAVGQCRLPMGEGPPELEDLARKIHAEL